MCFRAGNILVAYEDELVPLVVVGEASIILRDIPDEFFQRRLRCVQPLAE